MTVEAANPGEGRTDPIADTVSNEDGGGKPVALTPTPEDPGKTDQATRKPLKEPKKQRPEESHAEEEPTEKW